MAHATGTFEVKLTPQTPDDSVKQSGIVRMLIEKQFHGDLEAASQGQMLAVRSSIAGSAGYVAMEHVVGTLGGRTGAFALQHSGAMNRGEAQLTVSVVPDSGTGELAGLTGRMAITIADGRHSYDFDYAL
jgi:hypothetical protein